MTYLHIITTITTTTTTTTTTGLRYRNCPLGCRTRHMRKEMLDHISFHCPMRLVDCTLGCGNLCKHNKLTHHLGFCPNRKISCDKAMTPCYANFYEWFYKEIDIDDYMSYQNLDDMSSIGSETGPPVVGGRNSDDASNRSRSIASITHVEMGSVLPIAREPYREDSELMSLQSPLLGSEPPHSPTTIGLQSNNEDEVYYDKDGMPLDSHGNPLHPHQTDSLSLHSLDTRDRSDYRSRNMYAQVLDQLSVPDGKGGVKSGKVMQPGVYIDEEGALQLKDGECVCSIV